MSETSKENFMREIGERVRTLRLERGWSQEECAWRSEIALSHYRNIEKGRVNPSLDLLLRLATALDVDFDIAFGSACPLKFMSFEQSDGQTLREIAAELNNIANRL